MTGRNAFSALKAIVNDAGSVPLSWAGSTRAMDYLNLGDALSPVIVALCCGLPIERVPARSGRPRLAAAGTIGHGMERGVVWFWGSGSSNVRNPGAPAEQRVPYRPPANTEMILCATRGPISHALLRGGPPASDAVYGDPIWLLRRFYRPAVEKRRELGVILHLSELADRATEAHPLPSHLRYLIPGDLSHAVALINTVTSISSEAMRRRIDDILACKRIVSTSLHGMVLAESYRIPCLYFAPHGETRGPATVPLTVGSGLDLRFIDLYRGFGLDRLRVYVQPRSEYTDWDALIRAIDEAWQPVSTDEDALMAALPLELKLLAAPQGQTVFEHPLIRGLRFQHDVAELVRQDRMQGPLRLPI